MPKGLVFFLFYSYFILKHQICLSFKNTKFPAIRFESKLKSPTSLYSFEGNIAEIERNAIPDSKQKEAIIYTKSQFVMIIAGPGAGKTRVLSSRLAHLILSGICNPHEILVLSFSKSAALELRVRAEKMLQGTIATTQGVECETFHGFCSSVLRNHKEYLSLERDITIADENDQLKILISLLESKSYSADSRVAFNILRQIRYWKELGLGYLGISKSSIVTWNEKRAYELYPDYQHKLRSISALDFGDLLLFTLRLFRENPEILSIYRNKYQHILIDEFQDISPAQYDILRMLATGSIKSQSESSSSSSSSSSSGDSGGINLDQSQYMMSNSKYSNGVSRMLNTIDGGSSSSSSNADVRSSQQFQYNLNDPSKLARSLNVIPAQYNSEFPSFSSSSSSSNNPFDSIKKLSSPKSPIQNEINIKNFISVFCAGDDDQSIYAWRGAQIEIMRRFRFDFQDAKILKFDVSYRLPSKLNKVTNAIVEAIPGRIVKSFRESKRDNLNDMMDSDHENANEAYPIMNVGNAVLEVRRLLNPNQEMSWISSYIQKYLQLVNNYPISIAILGRTNEETKKISNHLKANKIPYISKFSDSNQFDSTKQLSLLNFIKLLETPHNNVAFQFSLELIENYQHITENEFTNNVIAPIKNLANSKSVSYIEAARMCVLTKKISLKYSKGLSQFIRSLDTLSQYKTSNELTFFDFLAFLQRHLIDLYYPYNDPTSVVDLITNMKIFKNVKDFLASVQGSGGDSIGNLNINNNMGSTIAGGSSSSSSSSSIGGNRESMYSSPSSSKKIYVLTMHAAKGLEFDQVILPFWNHGSVPRNLSPDERRLAFVSLTRARHKVMISFSMLSLKRVTVDPSIYIEEIVNNRECLDNVLFEDLVDVPQLSTSSSSTSSAPAMALVLASSYLLPQQSRVEVEVEVPQKSSSSSMIQEGEDQKDNYFKSPENIPSSSSNKKSKDSTIESNTAGKKLKVKSKKDTNTSSSKRIKVEEENSISLSTIESIEHLMNQKILKSAQLKILLSKEILKLLNVKRASIIVLENEKEVKKPISSCTTSQLAWFLIQKLKNNKKR